MYVRRESLIRDLLGHDGFQLILSVMREIAENEAMACQSCEPDQLHFHQEKARAFRTPPEFVQRVLDDGARARRWLAEHTP